MPATMEVAGYKNLIASIKLSNRPLESARTRFVTLAFWTVTAIVLVNMHWLHLWGMPLVRPVGYAAILVFSLILIVSNAGLWKTLGMPGAWIAAAVATYLIIGTADLFLTGAGWQEDTDRVILRQVFFFIIFLAAAIGGRAVLERTGIGALLRGVLAILTTSCFVILASPLLSRAGVLASYRLPYRLTGAFTDPNEAGFVGCMTIALATAFFCRDGKGGPRRLAVLGLMAGYTAALGSQSRTTIFAILAISLYLLTNNFIRQHAVLRWLPVPALAALVFHAIPTLDTFLPTPSVTETAPPSVTETAPPATAEVVRQIRGDNTESDKRRFSLWAVGFDMFLNSPIVGNGIGKLRSMAGGAQMNHENRPLGIHNLYLLLLGEAGIVPFTLYCLFLVSLTRFHGIASSVLARNTIASWMIAMALFGLSFHHLLTMAPFMFFAGLSCALRLPCKNPAELQEPHIRFPGRQAAEGESRP